MEKNKTIAWMIGGVVVLALAGFYVYQTQRAPEEKATSFITNFDDCAKAGYDITESYPRQCMSPEGNVYVEDVNAGGENTAVAKEGCYIGGCSSQICSDQPEAASTCEYKPEYSCYKSGTCERQANGDCGWTETSALAQCLNVTLGEFSK